MVLQITKRINWDKIDRDFRKTTELWTNLKLPDEVYHHMFVCALLTCLRSGGTSPLSNEREESDAICPTHKMDHNQILCNKKPLLTSDFMADSRSVNHL